jgi:Tol biopolymer transport system component
MRIVRLTMLPGEVADPAFSPDGEKIAFTSNGEDPVRFDLYVQLVEGGNPLRLTHIRSGYICCAAWSPDGKTIAFARCDDNGGAVFVIPVLGGPERKLTDVSCYWSAGVKPSWTADGNSLVMADRCAPDSPQGIVVFSLINGNKRCLHAPSRGEVGDFGPVLSPDQKSIAFLRTTSWNSVEIYTMSSTGENLRRLSYDNAGIWGMMWASDGQRVVFESTRSGLARIWQVPAAGGPVSPETVYPGVGTLTRDGKRLAYVWPSLVTSWSPEVWRLQLSSAGGRVMSQHRLFPPSAKAGGVKLSPDSQQIAFECLGTGNCEICKSKPDGSDSMQLTSYKNRTAGTPNWSPDGKWIAFDLQAGAHSQIYVMDGEGRNQHSVVSGEYDNSVPTWSRNGRFVYFASNRTGSWQIWRLELSTRSETQITFNGGFMAFESYDAQKLFYARFEEEGIWSVPVAGGKEQRIIDALHRGYYGHFAVAEDGIYFLDSDAEQGPTILYYSFETRRSTPVLVLKHDPVSYSASVAASRDGKTVFFDQVLSERSIQMVENFQ